jgi:hypothetical protein
VARLVGDAEHRERAASYTRDRSWDAKRMPFTYGLPPELHAELKVVAEEIVEGTMLRRLQISDIVREFLIYALEVYKSGDLRLEVELLEVVGTVKLRGY